MRHRNVLAATLVAMGGAIATGAQAHSPYLLPNAFDATGRDHVSVEAAFTEDYLSPEVVMKSDSWTVVGPDGRATPLTAVYARDLAVVEAATPANGTYRLSSGPRVGRTAKAAQVKGQWVFLEAGAPVPAGATPVDMQSITTAETYISRGAPDATAVKPRGQGVEFHALTHPNKIYADEDAVFELLLDGRPLAAQTIEVHRAGARYDDAPAKAVTLTTDAAGRFTIHPARAGVYHAMTRYRAGPAAPGQPYRSLTYALTFEATPQ